MTANAGRKRQTRELAEALGIQYTHASRLLITARETQPELEGEALRIRCNELLERERENAKRN